MTKKKNKKAEEFAKAIKKRIAFIGTLEWRKMMRGEEFKYD